MKRKILSDLKIHPVDFGKITACRQSIVLWIGFHLTEFLNLVLKVSDPLLRRLEFLIVFEHPLSPQLFLGGFCRVLFASVLLQFAHRRSRPSDESKIHWRPRHSAPSDDR